MHASVNRDVEEAKYKLVGSNPSAKRLWYDLDVTAGSNPAQSATKSLAKDGQIR